MDRLNQSMSSTPCPVTCTCSVESELTDAASDSEPVCQAGLAQPRGCRHLQDADHRVLAAVRHCVRLLLAAPAARWRLL